MNMFLSTYGLPTVLWMPQTWSPNSDTEQYFSENKLSDYALYNIRYVVTPPDIARDQIQSFWKLLEQTPSWRLYEVAADTRGYITIGVRPAIVASDKYSLLNVTRLWIQSDYPTAGLYPEITFDKGYPKNTGLPNFKMLDEVTYTIPDGSNHNLFAEVPRYVVPDQTIKQCNKIAIISQVNTNDMVFQANIAKPENGECLVILKQTYHPNWRATIDGEPATIINVFPFYSAVVLETTGNHEVIFRYQPSTMKQLLLLIVAIAVAAKTAFIFRNKRR